MVLNINWIDIDTTDCIRAGGIGTIHRPPPIVTGILREQLCYDGLILSDDMQMKAITSYYTLQQALQFVLEAGVDLLIFGNNCRYDEMITVKSVDFMKQLVLDGVISRERIDRSYQRIVRLKARLSVS